MKKRNIQTRKRRQAPNPDDRPTATTSVSFYPEIRDALEMPDVSRRQNLMRRIQDRHLGGSVSGVVDFDGLGHRHSFMLSVFTARLHTLYVAGAT